MEGSMLTALCYSCMWCTLYFTLCIVNSRRSYEWHCRTVTAIHASTISFISMWCGFVQGPWPFTDCGGPNTPLQVACIEICLGYFMFDLTWCLYFKSEGAVMLLHHICSIVAMTVATITGYYGTEMIAAIFGSELSNPLLQTRWFLRETGRYKTLLGEIVDHAFMFAFGFLRIVVGSYLLYSYYQQPTDMLGRFSGTVFYGISWMFWISIMQYGIRKYRKKFKKMKELKEMKDGKETVDDTAKTNGHVVNHSTQENGTIIKVENLSRRENIITSTGKLADENKICNGTVNGKGHEIQMNEDGLHQRHSFKGSEMLAPLDPVIN